NALTVAGIPKASLQQPPVVRSFTPAVLEFNNRTQVLTLEGERLMGAFRVYLNTDAHGMHPDPLQTPIKSQAPTRLEVYVPPMWPGAYDLSVSDNNSGEIAR